MGSASIWEIVEISNQSADAYFMYVLDDEHEGRYAPYSGDTDWYYPNDEKWYRINPGAHLQADDCGLPDGGKVKDGRNRTRVIWKAPSPIALPLTNDPNRGLRVNRDSLDGDRDVIKFRDNHTGEVLSEVPLPNFMHQSLSLMIDDKGARFVQVDSTASEESQVQEAFREIGEALEELGEILLEAIKRVPEAE